MSILSEADLQLSSPACEKMNELISQAPDEVEGIRVYAQAGCSGVTFGMTYADSLENNDFVREVDGIKIIVSDDTIEHLRGAEIDFVDRGDGNPAFVFNNLAPAPGASGCGSCSSKSSSCG